MSCGKHSAESASLSLNGLNELIGMPVSQRSCLREQMTHVQRSSFANAILAPAEWDRG